jgi:hypothetical protein
MGERYLRAGFQCIRLGLDPGTSGLNLAMECEIGQTPDDSGSWAQDASPHDHAAPGARRFLVQRILIVAAVAVLVTLTASTSTALAKLRVAGTTVTVSPAGVAPVSVTNPHRRTAKGKLTLTVGRFVAGSKAFRIPARTRRTVRVTLSSDAASALEQLGSMPARATAKAKGLGTARRALTLRSSQDGAPAEQPPGGGGGQEPAPQPAPEPAPAQPAWQSGRYYGTYSDNNADLAFDVTQEQLYTRPYDSFYVTAECPGSQYGSTSWAIEPVEARIGADGRFAAEGVYRPSPETAIDWKISGTISGTRVSDGEFSVSYTDSYGTPCSGASHFTARLDGAPPSRAVVAFAAGSKLRVGGGSVRVGEDGLAAIRLVNPSRKTVAGTLTLTRGGLRAGRKRFTIGPGGRGTVKVTLSTAARDAVSALGELRVTAAAKTRAGTTRRSVTLVDARSAGGGSPGSTPTPPPSPGGGGGGGGQDPGPAPAYRDGRWKGRDSTSTVFDVNVQNGRLWAGQYDTHGGESTCQNVTGSSPNPGDSSYSDRQAFTNLEASVASDGSFSGSGTDPGNGTSWSVSGSLAGERGSGKLEWSYTDWRGNPCQGSETFEIAWYGEYTVP